VFWLHNAAGLRDTYFGLGRFSSRPDGIYKGWVRRIFTSVLPFAIVVSFPTRALFEEGVGAIALHMAIVAVVGFGVLLLIWSAGTSAYEYESS